MRRHSIYEYSTAAVQGVAAMKLRQYHWDIMEPFGAYHCVRHFYGPGLHETDHGHDFAEVFWVEKGAMRHTINGSEGQLTAGDLVLIRPNDIHGLRCPANRGAVGVNVAFPREVLNAIRAQYFSAAPAFWGGEQVAPPVVHLDKKQRARLSAAVDELALEKGSRFGIDRFLLNLLHLLGLAGSRSAAHADEMPVWLQNACRKIVEPVWFVKGVPGFVELTGKTNEHVSRLCRKILGRQPTQIVNDARLDYAVRQLVLSDKSLFRISLDCGIASLPHFHRLFRERFGLSPRKYRARHRAMMG